MGINYKTKKEIILETACNDPFLKIDDISKIAKTTSPYVRTILSEANLSLMELRKNYVKKIEAAKYKNTDKLILNYLENSSYQSKRDIKIIDKLIINSPVDIQDIIPGKKNDFIYQSYKLDYERQGWSLCTVFLEKNFFALDDRGFSYKDLTVSLEEHLNKEALSFSDMDINVDISVGQINEILDISNLCPILRIKQTIKYESEILLLILLYFDTRKIVFSIKHNGEIIIRKKA
ncbi:MAG: hypothetical protein ACOC3B_00425 [Bacillota bacterium]